MAQPKRDYTIEDLSGSPRVHIHLNELTGELMGKILRVEGVIRCQAFMVASLFGVDFSLNYERAELLDELETLLAAHFAPANPVPDEFGEPLKP